MPKTPEQVVIDRIITRLCEVERRLDILEKASTPSLGYVTYEPTQSRED